MVVVRLEGCAVEDGIGVMKQDLLNDPPQGRSKGNMVIHSSGHTGVKEGKPTTIAVKDQRARVSVVGEISRGQVEVVNDDFLGLQTDVSADIALQTRVVSKRQTGLATILANHVQGVPELVDTVRISEKLARESLADLQQAIGGEPEAVAVGNVRPKLPLEFQRIIFTP
jgi:hypothetical protein